MESIRENQISQPARSEPELARLIYHDFHAIFAVYLRPFVAGYHVAELMLGSQETLKECWIPHGDSINR